MKTNSKRGMHTCILPTQPKVPHMILMWFHASRISMCRWLAQTFN